MKHLVLLAAAMAILLPSLATAQMEDGVIIEKASAKRQRAAIAKRKEETTYYNPSPQYNPYRKGAFRLGVVAPGIYAGNKTIDAMMSAGLEGEYFFFEKLSAGLRVEAATDFDTDPGANVILSFVPRARYVFDLDSHPRWAIYVQAGAGIALIDGDTVAADIAIPGGGFWWNWTDRWSVGADASLHILARSTTAVSFCLSPALRYQF